MTILFQPLLGSTVLGTGMVAASAASMELDQLFADMRDAFGNASDVDEADTYGRLISGEFCRVGSNGQDTGPTLLEQLQEQGLGFVDQGEWTFPANTVERIEQSLIRESGLLVPYRRTVLHKQARLNPSYMHCELDALAMARAIQEFGAQDVQILEIRSKGSELYHTRSIWRTNDHLTFYEGIHFAAIVDGCVYDLQTVLAPGLPLAEYLSQSFPHQQISTKTFYPNEFRARQRSSRHYHVARTNGFADFPELIEDTQFPDPQAPIKSLMQIMRESRERRVNMLALAAE